jgi:hypothetical protein
MSDLPLNLVYLRPDQPGIPVDYIKSIEKAGLVTLPQRYLAMYTLGGNPSIGSTGPQGPQGEDKNSWFDTIIASASDEFSPINTGGPKTHFRAPYPMDLTEGYVRCSLSTAPEGSAMIIDVHLNGVTIFSTPISIDPGSKTSVGSVAPAVLQTTYIPDDGEFTVFVDQVGSTLAGTGLKVAVTGIKTE